MNFLHNAYTSGVSKLALRRARHVVVEANLSEQKHPLSTLGPDALKDSFLSLGREPANVRAARGLAHVREAARRALGTPHYDVQLLGGHVLMDGKLAEMRTGEGKTLTITAPAALLALDRKGVHVVTANEYLAQRDAALMRPVYEVLGLSVGVTLSGMSLEEKQAAYACDVTYGVGSEFGFDYLKDNMVAAVGERVQRDLHAAIVDEVDSILIDEARVPLIIAEPASDLAAMVTTLDACVRKLKSGLHFEINLKERTADLTEAGYATVEEYLVQAGTFKAPQELYSANNLVWVRLLHAAVKAYALFRRDRDYVVTDGAVALVDISTGRAMDGRRLNDGLHEALEAREGLNIRSGTVTRATITYQSYFGRYPHLCGLTGTAATDAEEFAEIYNLPTVVIPTNKPTDRSQAEDLVYATKAAKFSAAVGLVKARHEKGQPVLVGCASIRDAELLDSLLTQAGLPHETLTAKHIAREAEIIARAGVPGAITVATNMAGRGTDIHLGGVRPAEAGFEDEAAFQDALTSWQTARAATLAAGGLFVLGTERNGLRRVDNQLAGRCGRQGDPGEVQFLLSLEDELLGVFGRSGQLALLRKMLANSESALGGATVGRLVTAAQQAVELQGFTARKSLLKFDSVLAAQRGAVYELRAHLLTGDALDYVQASSLETVTAWLASNMPDGSFPETWDAGALKRSLAEELGLDAPLLRWISVDELVQEEIAEKILALARERLLAVELTEAEARALAVATLDEAWAEHLTVLKELQDSAGLKSMAGQNAAQQFPKEAFELFQGFKTGVSAQICRTVMPEDSLRKREDALRARREARDLAQQNQAKVAEALEQGWIGRNASCPCGSGKRFKDCHGKL